LLDAQREASTKKEDRIAALQDHHERMVKLQAQVEALVRDLLPRVEYWAAEWYRLEAELWLAQANALPRPQKKEGKEWPGEPVPTPKPEGGKTLPRPKKE
jgi:hypothetical protein